VRLPLQRDLKDNHSKPVGSQWVHENFMGKQPYSDAWCDNDTNVVKPAYNFQAHMVRCKNRARFSDLLQAPLDIVFYSGSTYTKKGNAFVAFHGSWDRQPPGKDQVKKIRIANTYLLFLVVAPLLIRT
jgi:glucose/arabinose dehydrogenase